MSNSLLDDIFKGISDVCKVAKEAIEKNEAPAEEKEELLTAGKLHELRWMAPRQLAAIYGYGTKKTHIDDDPNAYHELRWFTEAQLKAIFGKDGMNA